jgi:ribosomal-protein-alanine N-acetyltransferase
MIRPFVASDAGAVAVIAAQSPGAAQWPESSYRGLESAGLLAWVADDGERVSGFLVGRVIGDEAEILNLAVSPSERRRSTATALLTAFFQSAEAQNVQSIFLEVRKSNAEAVAFYHARGFQITGERACYYHEPLEDALCMLRKLTH